MTMESQPALLDIEQAARRLGVDVRFMRRLVFEKRLPYIKVGKFVRFESDDIETWIADRRIEAQHRRPA